MPAKKYFTDADRPEFILGRLHAEDIESLHILVKTKHPDFLFTTLAQLNDALTVAFMTAQPWRDEAGFEWQRPKAVKARKTGTTGFEQHRFQFSPKVAARVTTMHQSLNLNQSIFLNTAVKWYLRQPRVQEVLAPFHQMRLYSETGAPMLATVGAALAGKVSNNQLADLIRQAQRSVAEAEAIAQQRRAMLQQLTSVKPDLAQA